MKRLIDIIGSSIGLLILAPVMLIVALVVWRAMGFPILFRQDRPGLHGQPFRLLKFRTMHDASDGNGKLLTDAHRLNSTGKMLRSTSLDEIPGLWNVLKGDMSLVGPRPLLLEYLPLYSDEQKRRHDVKPGLTGWAQINGRNAITWEEKFKLDIWYVDHRSVLLDVKIILLTIRKVLKREGISAPGQSTMQKFTGSKT